MFISRPLRQIVFADILGTMTSALDCDVLVAGGGPAGLAVAIAVRMNGLSAIVIERHPSPPDKACGECLMPPAVSALTRLGVLDFIDPARRASIDGIRFKQEGAASAEARLPSPGGLGVRRTELTAAMMHRARRLGARIHQRTSVRGYRVKPDQVIAETEWPDCRRPRADRGDSGYASTFASSRGAASSKFILPTELRPMSLRSVPCAWVSRSCGTTRAWRGMALRLRNFLNDFLPFRSALQERRRIPVREVPVRWHVRHARESQTVLRWWEMRQVISMRSQAKGCHSRSSRRSVLAGYFPPRSH